MQCWITVIIHWQTEFKPTALTVKKPFASHILVCLYVYVNEAYHYPQWPEYCFNGMFLLQLTLSPLCHCMWLMFT